MLGGDIAMAFYAVLTYGHSLNERKVATNNTEGNGKDNIEISPEDNARNADIWKKTQRIFNTQHKKLNGYWQDIKSG